MGLMSTGPSISAAFPLPALVTCSTLAASVASDLISAIVPLGDVAPLWYTDSNLPAPVIAVALEVTLIPRPDVRALRLSILRALPVVMLAPDRLRILPAIRVEEARI